MNGRDELPSIHSRLTVLVLAVTLAWGLAVSAVVWLTVREEVDELLDETLQASAEVMARLLASGDTRELVEPAVAPGRAGHEHFAWQLVGPGGAVLLRSARAPEQPFVALPTPGFADAASGWRLYGLRLAAGERMLYVAQTRSERQEAQAEVVAASVWATLAIGALSAWWLRRRVRRELRPLDDLSTHVAHYEPLPPAVPLPPAERRELSLLQESIESLGRRLARRVANERAFSAHAAHALRTPLAGIDTQLAVAQREAGDALQPRLARVREASARLTRVVSALLAMFRSGAEPQPRPLGLDALLQRLPHEGLEVRAPEGATLFADEELMTAALINLLDNAVRHGATRIDATLVDDGSRQRLRLHDDGRGAPPQRLAALNQALHGQAYEALPGLGLMLADLVARAHGGQVELPAVDRGFAVDLWLAAQAGAGRGAAR